VEIFGPAYSAFRRALERSQIKMEKGQASHVLRHTFASEFMRKGGNILVLQRALGHQSLAMTMRYAHLAPDHLVEVITHTPLAGISVGSLEKTKGQCKLDFF
jgi:site-specific recombinase XerD